MIEENLAWTCHMCGDERPDAMIKVAHRRVAGMEEQFPDTRRNVQYCADRPGCARVAGWDGVWPEKTDVDAVAAVLLRLEQMLHRGGWDNDPPFLYVIYRKDVPGLDQHFRQLMPKPPHAGDEVYAVRRMVSLLHPGLKPYESLRRFALNVAYAAHAEGDPEQACERVLRPLQVPGVVGFAVSYEAWQAGNSEDARRSVHENISMADMVGSKERRVVLAVTMDGIGISAGRLRGQKPEADEIGPMFRGDLSTSMRLLCDAVRGTPPTPELFDQRYPSLTDLIPAPGAEPTDLQLARNAYLADVESRLRANGTPESKIDEDRARYLERACGDNDTIAELRARFTGEPTVNAQQTS